MGALLLRLRTWWETADRTQRVVTIFGSAFLALLMAGTFYFASKPKMGMAYGGLTPSDVGSIVGEVQKMGVPVESDLQGNVFVPTDKISEVRSKIAMSGKSPASGHMGNQDLSKLNSFSTPTVEREQIKTILEGELAQSIEAIEGVAKARVHITLGERSAFATNEKPSTASIFVQEKSTSGLGPDAAKAIATLVSRGVPGLELANVFVVDSAGRSLFDGSTATGSASQANEKLAAEVAEAARRERDLQSTFDATFGRGNTVVKVNLSMDFDKKSVNLTTDTPTKTPLVRETAKEEVAGGGSNAGSGGSPGLGTNSGSNNTTGGQNQGNAKGYTADQEYVEYGRKTSNEKTEKAVGEITNMAVAVMVNEGKADPEAVRGFLTSYLAAYKGAKGEVTEVKFDTTLDTEAKKAQGAAASQAQMQQIFSLLPILALVGVAFVVLKALAKTAKSSNVLVSALPGGGMVSHGSALAVAGGGSSHGARDPHAFEHSEVDALKAAIEAEEQGNVDELVQMKEKFNLPLEQLKKMATERPESVAMLMKSWMLEERR